MESRLPTVDLEKLERIAIQQALAENNDNRTHAAKALGISVRTLQRKLLRKVQLPLFNNQSIRGLVTASTDDHSNFGTM